MTTYPNIVVTGTLQKNASTIQSTIESMYLNSPAFRSVLDAVAARYPNVIIDVSSGNGYPNGVLSTKDGSFSGQDKNDPNTYRIYIDPSMSTNVIVDGQLVPATVESEIAHEFTHATFSGNGNDPVIENQVRAETNIIMSDLKLNPFTYPPGDPVWTVGINPFADPTKTFYNDGATNFQKGIAADSATTAILKFDGATEPGSADFEVSTETPSGIILDKQQDATGSGRINLDQTFQADGSSVLTNFGYTLSGTQQTLSVQDFNSAQVLTETDTYTNNAVSSVEVSGNGANVRRRTSGSRSTRA